MARDLTGTRDPADVALGAPEATRNAWQDGDKVAALTERLEAQSHARLMTPGASMAFLVQVGLIDRHGDVSPAYRSIVKRERIALRKTFSPMRRSKLKRQMASARACRRAHA